MKSKFYLPLIAMAIGMGGCTNDLVEEVNPIMGKQDVIAVNVGDESTRTAMDGVNVVWSTGDAIGVFAGSMNNEYLLNSGAGTTSAEFTGLAPQSLKEVAYFPFVESANWDDNTISTTLPTTYTYSAESNNNAVMAALMTADAQSSISFQNAGALYAITVENIPEGYDKAVMTYLNAEDNVGIAGDATITFAGEVPTLTVPKATDAASAKKAITITFTGTGNKTFYFPMPVIEVGDEETFPGLQFSIQGTEKTIAAPIYPKAPQRNKLYAETLTLDNVSGGIVTEAANVAAANAALANDAVTSVAVKDVLGTEPITIPAKSESADVPHTIDLSEAELPTGDNKLTINVDNTTDNTTVKELTVVVPDAATAGNLVIEAPGTTVTIQAANGTVLDTIKAKTADNTLIIGEGVTIKNLTIMQGNVVLKGNVESIESEVNTTTTITLVDDITLAAPITLSKGNVTFDLGGKTLTAPTGAFVVANGTLTVKNGTIDANVKGYDAIAIKGASEESVIAINVESDATIKGGDCCVVVYGSNKSKNITINTEGTLVTESAYESSSYPGYAAISANANSEGVKMNVTGGSITAKVAAIYFPCKTSLTISDGTITGATAVYQKSGELTISGGKLVGNGEKKEYVFNNNGCNETGDALVVESCNYPKGAPTISITGGEFVSENASAIGSYVGNGATEKVTGFVKGGTFSDASVFDFLADNANVTLGANITLSSVVNIKKTVTINLNGKDIIHPASSGDAYGDVFDVLTGGNLTIMGEGRVISENGYSVYAGGDAKVLLEKGKYYSPVSAVYAQKAAVVTIVGGEYYADVDPTTNTPEHSAEYGHNFTINLRDKKNNYVGDTSEIIIKGGKFYKFDPANNAAEGVGTNFVAPGYSAVANGDYYEVKPGIYNETALKGAIVNGAEITLDDDIEITDAITIAGGKEVTINLSGKTIENKTAGHPSMISPEVDDECVVFMVTDGKLTIEGEGNVKATGDDEKSDYNVAVWVMGENAEAVINGGTYTNSTDTEGDGCDLIYGRNGAKITINGGSFQSHIRSSLGGGNGTYDVLDCKDYKAGSIAQSTITVNGGKFQNYAPSYENVGTNEVVLGNSKAVYNGVNIVTTKHDITAADVWYEVK